MPYDDSEPVHPLVVLLVIAALCGLVYAEIARHPKATCVDAAIATAKQEPRS